MPPLQIKLLSHMFIALISAMTPDQESPIASYHNRIYEADSLVIFHKDYALAVYGYKEAFQISEPFQYDILNLALLCFLSGDTAQAETYIKSCYLDPRKLNLYENAYTLGIEWEESQYNKFTSLYKASWNRDEWKRRKKLPGSRFLKTLYRKDQFYRKRLIPFFLNRNRDKNNFNTLVKYVEQNGVPGVRSSMDTYFLREGLDYFSYILNHNLGRPYFIDGWVRLYPHLITALNQGEIYPYTLPFLMDKFLWIHNDNQIFGMMNLISHFDNKGLPVYSTRKMDLCVTEEKRDSLRSDFFVRPALHSLKVKKFKLVDGRL